VKQLPQAATDSIVSTQKKDQGDDNYSEENVHRVHYYKLTRRLFSLVHGYEFQISATVAGGFRWLKKLDGPENGLPDLTKGRTKYLSSKLTLQDYENIQEQILNTSEISNDPKLLNYLLPCICLGEGNANSPLLNAITKQLALAETAKAKIELFHSTGLTSRDFVPEKVVSFIPEHEQFPKSLQESELSWSDFLPWFYGPAEAECFALHVGRAGTGPQGATLAGESSQLEHSYRQAIILKSEPYLGKSYFNNFLIEGFDFCNLTTAPIHNLNSQFGHAEWLTAAWAYADDTTKALLNSFYNSEVLKSACSNGIVKTEKKGVDSIAIKAVCAPILLANDTDSRDSAKADTGNANRIRVLSTVSLSTARALEQVPAVIIIKMCEQYNVTQACLSAYFIRLCVDHFRSFTLESLAQRCNDLETQLYSRLNATAIQSLATASVFAYRCQVESLKALDWAQNNDIAGNSTEFIAESVIALANIRCVDNRSTGYKIHAALFLHYHNNGRPQSHPYVGFRNFGFQQIIVLAEQLKIYLSDLKNSGKARMTTQEYLHKTFSGLVDAQGVSVSYSLATLQERWRHALNIGWAEIDTVAKEVLQQVIDDQTSDLAGMRNDGHKKEFSATFKLEQEINFDSEKSYEELTKRIRVEVEL
jgi:hypothetical protein